MNNHALQKSRKILAQKTASFFFLLFIVGQVVVFPLVYYNFLVTPKRLRVIKADFLLYVFSYLQTNNTASNYTYADEYHDAFNDLPKGSYIKLVGVYTGTTATMQNASYLLDRESKEFMWLVNHMVIETMFSYDVDFIAKTVYLLNFTGTLKDYISQAGTLKSLLISSNHLPIGLDLVAFMNLTDKSVANIDVQYLKNQVEGIILEFTVFQQRDSYLAYKAMESFLILLLPFDIFFGIVLKIEYVEKVVDKILGKLRK